MSHFYCEALGLAVGPRPDFSFAGAWLYCGPLPVIHLVLVDAPAPRNTDLALEHFAFRANDLSVLLSRLNRLEVAHRIGFVRDFGLCQVHVRDPDGNHVHIDFDLAEAREAGLDTS
jgi:catechol 2,3-dioxygenase-like lactoylglutathione lyase family enzyme